MKVQRFLSLLFLFCLIGGSLWGVPVQAAAPQAPLANSLRISQVYGAGGNSGAVYRNDYVEIFNSGPTTLSLSGMSVQYTSATGTGNFGSNPIVSLNGSLAPGHYFLVQLSGGTNGASLPTPDAIGTINMGGSAGKVILVNSTTGLACNGGSTPCTSEQLALIVDLVGYGNANFYEGSAAVPSISVTTAALRANAGCIDTDNNIADFSVTAPNPRNTTSTAQTCAVVDVPPTVFSTAPANGAVNIATNANLDINFSESVTVTGNWAQVSCSSSGVQSVGAGALVVSGGAQNYTLNPASDFLNNETCTATVYASQVLDQDVTPESMVADYSWSFSIVPDVVPFVSSTMPANGAVNISVSAPLVIHFSESVDLAADAVTLVCAGNPVMLLGLPASDVNSVTFNYAGSLPLGVTCNAEVVAALVTDNDGTPDPLAATYAWDFSTVSTGPTLIHFVQGSVAASSLVGQNVTIEGIVVGDFQSTVSGFFVQEEDVDADADPLTSEGIFVYATTPVNLGDRVSVTGRVDEYYDETEITNSPAVTVLNSANPLPAAASMALPIAVVGDWERYEGMLVTFPQTLFVAETYLLGRGGMLTLADQRIYQPTHLAQPGAPALAVAAENARHIIILDDGSQAQNTDPIRWPSPAGLSAANTVRNGDQVSGVQGILTQRYHGWSDTPNAYRIYPTVDPTFIAANPRSTSPARVGTLRVASFNVLNYFNGNGAGGGFPTSRGAETLTEFNRQRAKIIAAIIGLDADVIGLMEIENDGYASTSAIQDLVNGLNAAAGAGTYSFINPGVSPFGGDEITVGLLYRTARVTPVGTTAYTDEGAFAQVTGRRNRQPLAQTFQETASGEQFAVVVNHFKSKGSSCAAAGGVFPADPDLADGQGECNLTRTLAAQDLIAWLATSPTGISDPDILVIGDLNAYAQEDPITAFRTAGYIDLPNAFLGSTAYSYVFDGQLGYLDHALASPSLAAQVTAAGEWHINADEPISLDYNTDYKSAGQIASLYAADAYRASDHDPVVIDLFLPYGRADLSDLPAGYGLAWHRAPSNTWLGVTVNNDLSFAAEGDNAGDDGVVCGQQNWLPGGTVSLTVQIGGSGPAWLAGWFDWNLNGAFDTTELGINRSVSVGSNVITVTIPAAASVIGSALPTRFRLYESATEPLALARIDDPQAIDAADISGGVVGGEVEDYAWDFGPTAVTLHSESAASRSFGWLAALALSLLIASACLAAWRLKKTA